MTFYAVQHRPTKLFLRSSRFKPGTTEPLLGSLSQSWIPDSKEEAIAQAKDLGQDWRVVPFDGGFGVLENPFTPETITRG
jgi:hypothetical protein